MGKVIQRRRPAGGVCERNGREDKGRTRGAMDGKGKREARQQETKDKSIYQNSGSQRQSGEQWKGHRRGTSEMEGNDSYKKKNRESWQRPRMEEQNPILAT